MKSKKVWNKIFGLFTENFADFHDHSELPMVNSQEFDEFEDVLCIAFYVVW